MPLSGILRSFAFLLLLLSLARPAQAQDFPFTSGPIPPCDTSAFTATVSGVGWLITPDGWNWGPYIDNVVLNITTDHPQTLQISLTSPEGTTLLLSAFNGAGGQNYTNTVFPFYGGANIVGAAAPFNGTFSPQGGGLSAFTGENADGVWTITVIDTACGTSGPGPGGTWTPGWFNGGVGSGAFAFGFASPPPPCFIDMGSQGAIICSGQTVDVLTNFETSWGGMGITFSVWYSWSGVSVADPYNVTDPGDYQDRRNGLVWLLLLRFVQCTGGAWGEPWVPTRAWSNAVVRVRWTLRPCSTSPEPAARLGHWMAHPLPAPRPQRPPCPVCTK